MNPSTRLKWSAIVFAGLWIVGMVCWDGSFSRANLVTTTIGGVLLGYVWYRFMRWWVSRSRIPAHGRVSAETETKS